MILVTGAAGLIGTALVSELGDKCIALSHYKPVHGVRSLAGDVTRPWLGLAPHEYWDLAAQVDVVAHCAACVNFSASPEQLHNMNVRGVGHVLRFVEDADARLVQCGTAFVARAGDGSPFDAYASSKATGEMLVHESGLPACVGRISTAIGDSATGEIARLQSFHYLLGIALWGQLPFLPCSPGTCVDVIPRDVVAASLAALCRSPRRTGEYWLTAGPAALPMERVIDIACEIAASRPSRNEMLRDFDQSVFRTRLIDPATAERVINAAVASGSGRQAPSMIQHAARLMSAFDGAEPFPTSIGEIPGGPPRPTRLSLERALHQMIRNLADMPPETFQLR